MLLGAAFGLGGGEGGEAFRCQVRHRFGGQVAVDQAVVRAQQLPHQGRAQLRRLALLLEQAGLDLQYGFHKSLLALLDGTI